DDNDGFGSRSLRLGAGVALGEERRTVVSAGAEYRHVERERPGFTGEPTVEGWGGDVGAAHRFGNVRLGVRAGALRFTGAATVPTWLLGADGRLAGGSWRAAVAGGPAYETLRAGTTLGAGVDGGDDDVLEGVSASGTVNVPLSARLELWSRGEWLGLDDDNARANLQAALRYGLAPSLSALYSGGVLTFSDATATYWSPRYYTLHSLGLEWRRRWPRGLLIGAQGLAGVSWYDETLPGGPDASGSAFQWSLAGELGWQTTRWDLGVTGAYGTDRGASGYEAFLGTLRARYRW
ncbi:MAG TPA: hypothetical protein VFX50_15305, partial [Gemmatimonadales bacterium]|nr:hypothetical protein [Gemmatimonadales bacterium]